MTVRVQARNLALILGVGVCGGALFAWLRAPVPWLLGSMMAVALAALAGAPVFLPSKARDIIVPVIGVSLGSGVTSESVIGMLKWPVSLCALLIAVALSVAASTAYLVRHAKWNRSTAFLASVPGAMTQVLLHATHTPANMGLVVLTHLFRLVMLMAILPLLVAFNGHTPADGGGAISTHAPTAYWAGTAEIAAGIVLGYALAMVRLPAGMLIGGMIAAAAMHLSGLAEGQLPFFMLVPCHVALGAFFGQGFRGTDVRLLRQTALPSAGAFVITLALSCASALVVATGLRLPIALVMVAFAPGALEGMAVLALALGVDPTFVAVHHLVRFIGVTLILALAGKFYIGDVRP